MPVNASFLRLLAILTLVTAVGCPPEPPPEPPPPAPDPGPDPPTPKSDRISVLTEPWNAGDDVNWQVAELLGEMSTEIYNAPGEAAAAIRSLGFDGVLPFAAGSTVAAVASSNDVAVVVFRGTDDLHDWLINLQFNTRDVDGGPIHAGFHDAYQSVRSDIRAAVEESGAEFVWITGHSLGGALAVVCAYDFRQNDSLAVTGVVTYGQPMVGQPGLPAHLDTLLDAKYQRFVNGSDVVTQVPPLFRHCGSYVWFDGEEIRRPQTGFRMFALQDGQQPAASEGPPQPLTEEEFQRLRSQLRRSQNVSEVAPPQVQPQRMEDLKRRQIQLRRTDNGTEPSAPSRQMRVSQEAMDLARQRMRFRQSEEVSVESMEELRLLGGSLPWVRDHGMALYLERIRASLGAGP